MRPLNWMNISGMKKCVQKENKQKYEIDFRAKPDVIHYVDSPIIKPKIKESKEEDVIKKVTIIKDKEDKKTSLYGKFKNSPPPHQPYL